MSLVSFLFLTSSDASLFVERWRPQNVAGNIVSVSGVNSYARARITLRDPKCVGMLVNVRNVGYVVHKTGDAYNIASCLWPKGTPSLQEFRDFREWCSVMDVNVGADGLQDPVERDLWNISMFDA